MELLHSMPHTITSIMHKGEYTCHVTVTCMSHDHNVTCFIHSDCHHYSIVHLRNRPMGDTWCQNYEWTRTHARKHTRTHACTNTHAHTHTHTHTQQNSCSPPLEACRVFAVDCCPKKFSVAFVSGWFCCDVGANADPKGLPNPVPPEAVTQKNM